jgi:hypothetical protein
MYVYIYLYVYVYIYIRIHLKCIFICRKVHKDMFLRNYSHTSSNLAGWAVAKMMVREEGRPNSLTATAAG